MTDAPSRDEICRAFESAPYYRHLGMRASSDADGASRVELPHRPEVLQLYGGIHGGALMSLADAAGSIAVATTMAANETVATVDLSIQFLEPAGDGDVIARGRVTKRGRRLAFAECVLSVSEREIARAHGVWRIGVREGAGAPDR